MLMEVRRYELVPGRRTEFVNFFDQEVLPAMREAGMQILGQFVAVDDPNVFYYLRCFEDEEERAAQTAAFYESSIWLDALKERALDMETGWSVEVVTPTAGSAIR